MLSFIYRLMKEYENKHGIRPNLIYINSEHFNTLRRQLESCRIEALPKLLGMDVVLSNDASHPHVARADIQWGRAANA
ncbi:MAG: hypothetical protein OEW89_00025 [Gammaproteobacteria bacterium]|nr:hypothetical protein [Gammaproteobacteria bacterium]MDH5594515.1 hypothetical protein [Gammaproteobacteria bacterium]MDH5614807.1 hypothetical protein [Gammaproteobacteria bacterium]